LDTYATAADLLPDFDVPRRELAHYRIDEGRALGRTKELIVQLISAWEDHEVEEDNVTLCHSVSEATLATLIFLKRKNISTIIFETPGYGVTINQAKHLGLSVLLCPTYTKYNYQIDLEALNLERLSPCALWLTQPRMSLGFDQSIPSIESALDKLSDNDFLVIDEATEQHFPSHLRGLWKRADPRIIRLRGFLKGAGLNGLRLAFLLHHARLRSSIEGSQEVIGTSLDAFSLQAAVAVAEAEGRLKDLLHVANQQTTSLRIKAERISFGTDVHISRLVNGYIGCAMLDLRQIPGSYEEKRKSLLRYCFERRMPVLLGASMRFAFDADWERIRLNYFTQTNQLLRGIANLVEFVEKSRK